MSKLKDLIIEFEADAERSLEGAETFDEFVNTMYKINPYLRVKYVATRTA
jgi:hypothetical protein